MILRDGVTTSEAARTLRMLADRLSEQSREPLHDWYIAELDALENILSNRFEPASVAAFIDNPRHWHIVTTHDRPEQDAWVEYAIDLEHQLRRAQLAALRDQFEHLSAWLPDGALVLADTNTLMHSQPVDKIPWNTELGPDDSAIVRGPGDVPITLDIPRDDIGRVRMAKTGDELIAFGAFLKHASGGNRAVTVVTRDMNLQIRAQRMDLSVLWLPEKYSKDQPTKDKQ